MTKYDITSVDGRIRMSIRGQVDAPPQHTHLWKQDNPGAPIECAICGTQYIETKPADVVKREIWDRIRDGLRSDKYGYG